ncbi:MAG: alpha-E domain-containing protein [Acidimicrobiia bacterium]|nr:alpha-E domain-containing protein [Acidimicrobiia bacterium]
MLSRHAEHLFWIGRYVERAEDTARMLDVTYHTLLESPPSEEGPAWRELLEVLHLHEVFDDEPTAAAVSRYLVLDPANPGSVVSAVDRARTNAQAVRDRISTEMWEAINAFFLELQEMDLGTALDRRPYEVFRTIKNRCQAINGVSAQTMPRDDGYRFSVLGLMLERAEMTCRLLAVRYARLTRGSQPMWFHAWVAVLKSVSAFEAYLKEHEAALEPTRVLEFLLLSTTFPRSVLYCLRVAETQLGGLTPGTRSTAQRLLGRVRARCEFADVDEILDSGLDQFLEELQQDIYDVAEAVDAHFFRSGTDLDLRSIEST